MNINLATACLSLLVTMLGWLFVKEKEGNARRNERELEYINRQIAELYGPIFNLIQQIWSFRLVCDALPEGNKIKIRIYYWNRLFKPAHEKIINIMENKMHLMLKKQHPDVFSAYLKHALYQMVQFGLWQEEGIDIGDLKIPEWPMGFENDIKDGLKFLMEQRSKLLKNRKISSY